MAYIRISIQFKKNPSLLFPLPVGILAFINIVLSNQLTLIWTQNYKAAFSPPGIHAKQKYSLPWLR